MSAARAQARPTSAAMTTTSSSGPPSGSPGPVRFPLRPTAGAPSCWRRTAAPGGYFAGIVVVHAKGHRPDRELVAWAERHLGDRQAGDLGAVERTEVLHADQAIDLEQTAVATMTSYGDGHWASRLLMVAGSLTTRWLFLAAPPIMVSIISILAGAARCQATSFAQSARHDAVERRSTIDSSQTSRPRQPKPSSPRGVAWSAATGCAGVD